MPTPVGAATGRPHTLRHGGSSYEFSLITQGHKAKYQRLLEQNARQAVIESRSQMGEDEWRTVWTATIRDIASGVYAFHGTVCNLSMQDYGGIVGLVSVVATRDGNSITLAEANELCFERMEEVSSIMNRIFEESFPNRYRLAGGAIGNDPVREKGEPSEPSSP